MRLQCVVCGTGAGAHVVGGYHDGSGGQVCRNCGTATLGAGNGCAGTTLSGCGLHAVRSDIAISGRLSRRKLCLICTVCLRGFLLIDGLFMRQSLLRDHRRCGLCVLELLGLHPHRFGIGHSAAVEVPCQKRHPDQRGIRCGFQRQTDRRRHQRCQQAGHT